jgi:hypothetical protein
VDPGAEYERLRSSRRSCAGAARRAEGRLANVRLGLVAATALSFWVLSGVPLAIRLGIPAAAFVGLLVLHDRARRALTRADRSVAYYDRAIARLNHDFAGHGETGAQWLIEDHPYATHLDLFGVGSLYELLCGARTSGGRETLAGWLLTGAKPDVVIERQRAVEELRDRLDLREELATIDERIADAFASRDIVGWATAPPLLVPGPLRVATIGVAGATGVAALGIGIWGTPPVAWLLLVELALWWRLRRRVAAVISDLERPVVALRLLRDVLARIERERFESDGLARIERVLGAHDPPASIELGSLLRRVDALDWRRNQIFLPLALALMWGTNWAFAIEAWRVRHGAAIRGWIDAVGELEALLDLATLAYERPEYTFPDVIDGTPRLRVEGLAHPLLPSCTPNDVALDAETSLLVVTGSNMSGKSTLLRSLGTNAVLAQAGAPVRARSMSMTPLSIGASIRTVDSLRDGASRFYAEIRALKRAVDAAESRPPGLFLLDELLHGTNSHDRRMGAEAIVRAFLARGALGIVTTHDLALAAIADELGPRADNRHFEFDLDGAEIRFDYRLRPGVVRSGNALAIMRAIGLEV